MIAGSDDCLGGTPDNMRIVFQKRGLKIANSIEQGFWIQPDSMRLSPISQRRYELQGGTRFN